MNYVGRLIVFLITFILIFAMTGCMTPQQTITEEYNSNGVLTKKVTASESLGGTLGRNLYDVTKDKITVTYDNSWLFALQFTFSDLENFWPTGKIIFGKKDKALMLTPKDADPGTIKAVNGSIQAARASEINLSKAGSSVGNKDTIIVDAAKKVETPPVALTTAEVKTITDEFEKEKAKPVEPIKTITEPAAVSDTSGIVIKKDEIAPEQSSTASTVGTIAGVALAGAGVGMGVTAVVKRKKEEETPIVEEPLKPVVDPESPLTADPEVVVSNEAVPTAPVVVPENTTPISEKKE